MRTTHYHHAGLTLLEVLAAVVVLSIALLAVSAGIMGNFTGIRDEGRITVANQVAVSVQEELRRQISAIPELFDKGLSEVPFEPIKVTGGAYGGHYNVTPLQILGDGSLTDKISDQPHVYLLHISVDLREDRPQTYSTLIVRNLQP